MLPDSSLAPNATPPFPSDLPLTPSNCPASAYDFLLPGYEFAPPGHEFVFTGYEFLPSLNDCGAAPGPGNAKSDCGNRQIKQRRRQIIPRDEPIKWGSRPIIPRNDPIKWEMVKFIHRRHVRGHRNPKIIRIGPVLGFPPLFGSSRRLPGSRRARRLAKAGSGVDFPVDAICQRR